MELDMSLCKCCLIQSKPGFPLGEQFVCYFCRDKTPGHWECPLFWLQPDEPRFDFTENGVDSAINFVTSRVMKGQPAASIAGAGNNFIRISGSPYETFLRYVGYQNGALRVRNIYGRTELNFILDWIESCKSS